MTGICQSFPISSSRAVISCCQPPASSPLLQPPTFEVGRNFLFFLNLYFKIQSGADTFKLSSRARIGDLGYPDGKWKVWPRWLIISMALHQLRVCYVCWNYKKQLILTVIVNDASNKYYCWHEINEVIQSAPGGDVLFFRVAVGRLSQVLEAHLDLWPITVALYLFKDLPVTPCMTCPWTTTHVIIM